MHYGCILLLLSLSATFAKVELKGKTVLVTGASSGIGEAISRDFAALGMNVVLAARRSNNLERIINEIKQAGGSAISVIVDVTSEADQQRAFKLAEETFGAVHFVVANAGVSGIGGDFIAMDTAIEETRKIYDVNVIGVLISIREGVKALRKAGGGAIIAISSASGTHKASFLSILPLTPFLFGYGPSKAAIDQIVRSSSPLISENIRVYSLGPFVYHSEMIDVVLTGGILPPFLNDPNTFNPIFPKVGNPSDLSKVMSAIFDNTTAYPPTSLIYCDNDGTWAGHESYKQLDTPGMPEYNRSVVRDVTGHIPYFTETEEKGEL